MKRAHSTSELVAEIERLRDENERLRQRIAELPYPFYVAPTTMVPLACGGLVLRNERTGLVARVR